MVVSSPSLMAFLRSTIILLFSATVTGTDTNNASLRGNYHYQQNYQTEGSSPAGLPKVAWIMSFPHSGSTYTSKILSTAEAMPATSSKPLYDHIVHTHCGGIGMSDRRPGSYVVDSPRSFLDDCVTNAGFTVDPSAVRGAVRLVRNPMDNVVARFRYEFTLHAGLPAETEPDFDNGEETKRKQHEAHRPAHNIPQWSAPHYSPDMLGFQKWCRDTDERFLDEDLRAYSTESFQKSFRVPCHSEFFKYIQWHNMAAAVVDYLYVDAVSVRYEDYRASKDGVAAVGAATIVDALTGFLGLPSLAAEKVPPFHFQSFYREYYSVDQMEAIAEFCQTMASEETWAEIGPYFDFITIEEDLPTQQGQQQLTQPGLNQLSVGNQELVTPDQQTQQQTMQEGLQSPPTQLPNDNQVQISAEQQMQPPPPQQPNDGAQNEMLQQQQPVTQQLPLVNQVQVQPEQLLQQQQQQLMQPQAPQEPDRRALRISTWNVAAINNNPFEYWITINNNPAYEKLMIDVEKFVEEPGERDIPVSSVFTDAMFDRLEQRMLAVGWDPDHKVRAYWTNEFRNRRIVSDFLKDPSLGSKRLASMPDRVTNTINVASESGGGVVCRPTVINMYEDDLGSIEKWWEAWMDFMFEKSLPIKNPKSGMVESMIPYQMLKPISKAKYPAVTPEEEEVSLPLQTMCGAIFDAILVHTMNTVSTPDVWQPLKRSMVDGLSRHKVSNTRSILSQVYGDADIISLQEVSSAFLDEAMATDLAQLFHVVAPMEMDAVRDQNSVILLNRRRFPNGSQREVTALVEAAFPPDEDVPVAKGDIMTITAVDGFGDPYVISSFHGDTNGLATIPVLRAVLKAISDSKTSGEEDLSNHRLIFGLDANTYEEGQEGKKQDVMEFGKEYLSHELTSCWGDMPDPKNYTTYNARTFLQPQLNKACRSAEKELYGDINPKDFILFRQKDFDVARTWKDNTGKMEYVEHMAFPTLDFPSDHGILSTELRSKGV